MTSLGEQTWFPSGSRTLEGWVHRPDDGRTVGAVVIAGPFAHEALVAYRAIRVLAVEAARRGFVTVRFSWSGTGDSEPAPADVDLATAWKEDLTAAVELARAASGVDAIDAIGVRFGASVVAAADIPLRTRVLWEPLGGRAFLRMQSSLLKLHLPAGFPLTTQGVELCGYTLDDAAAAALRTLPDPRSAATSDGIRLISDDQEAADELFGREPQFARVPLSSIENALDALEPGESVALPEWAPERELVHLDGPSGARLRHTFVEVGSSRLPGIYTEPVDAPRAATAALLVPFSNDPKGVDRITRATSVRLARIGVPTLRADRNGIGDAANPRDLIEVPTFTEAGIDDVAQFASWLSERTGSRVTGIGLCSGAWLLARAAAAVPFRQLIMINNLAWGMSTRHYTKRLRADAAAPQTPGSVAADATAKVGPLRRLRRGVRAHAPYLIRYRLFSLFHLDEIAETLLEAVPEQTSITMLFGTDGDQRSWQAARGPDSVRRLGRQGRRIEVEYDERADHALMSEAGLELYLDLLDREFELKTRPLVSGAATA